MEQFWDELAPGKADGADSADAVQRRRVARLETAQPERTCVAGEAVPVWADEYGTQSSFGDTSSEDAVVIWLDSLFVALLWLQSRVRFWLSVVVNSNTLDLTTVAVDSIINTWTVRR